VYCAFVQGNTIKKISTPLGFRSKAIAFVDWATEQSATGPLLNANSFEHITREFYWDAGGGQTISLPDKVLMPPSTEWNMPYDIYKIWDRAPGANLLNGFGGTQTITGNNQPLYRPSSSLTNYPAQYSTEPDANKMLGLHYGLGLSTGSSEYEHGVTSGLYTPAIYSYLNQSLTISNNSMTSYQYVKNSLANLQAPVPNKLLVVKETQTSTTGEIQIATTAAPTSLTIKSNLTALPKTSQKTISYNPNNGGVSASWNWGRPDYCRSQLLALGFSAQDLAPATTP
jgi:hypothetical protein